MEQPGDFTVRFWGVRGSIACPGPETVRYGGNTSCLEVRCGEHLLILDGGTGLRELGRDLLKKGGKVDADLFYSHTHFDHICGLPFVAPCFIPGHKIRMWAGHLLPEMNLETQPSWLRWTWTSSSVPIQAGANAIVTPSRMPIAK